MKKLLTILFLFYASVNFAQINLEHTYPVNVNLVQIGASDWNYYTYINPTISIYDITHSLIKNITVPSLGSGWETEGISYLSTNLFNTDSYYEYGVIYFDTIPPYGALINYRYRIYNELGTQLFSIDSSDYLFCYNTSSGLKMIVDQNHIHTGKYYAGNVYSLGGNFLSTDPIVNNGNNSDESKLAFPNPSNNMIHLAYELPTGADKAEMVVTNLSGQVVKTCNVGSAFTDILLDTKQYTPGEYLYYIHTDNYTSQTNKFIITR